MQTITPREADIEAAKTYLRQRLDAEYSMTYNLGLLMREAAERVVEIMYSANVPPAVASFENLPARVQWDINEVLDWLKEAIDDYFQTLAIADHEENRDAILPYIFGESHGMTFNNRLTDYVGKYKNELFLLVGAGIFLGIAKTTLAKSIGDNLKRPYANTLIADGIAAPLTYGRGRSNSMYNAINALTKFGIGRAWMYNRHLRAEMEQAQGFVTFRNSTYPCDICNEYAGQFHPMDDPLPPLHSACVCGTIYVNTFGEPIKF